MLASYSLGHGDTHRVESTSSQSHRCSALQTHAPNLHPPHTQGFTASSTVAGLARSTIIGGANGQETHPGRWEEVGGGNTDELRLCFFTGLTYKTQTDFYLIGKNFRQQPKSVKPQAWGPSLCGAQWDYISSHIHKASIVNVNLLVKPKGWHTFPIHIVVSLNQNLLF